MTGEEHREQAQGEQHMAAIMREWQTAIPTGGHKAVQQLQREKKRKEQERDGVEEEGRKF